MRTNESVAVGRVGEVPSATPLPSPALRPPSIEVAVAFDRLCARVDGRVHCAAGRPNAPLVAPPPEFTESATSLAVGSGLICIATSRGTVQCKGYNTDGQLGAGIADDERKEPTLVAGVARAKSVATGDSHACAVLDDGSVRCWGRNRLGETGGTTAYEQEVHELALPNAVPAIVATRVAAGSFATCALAPLRSVSCWGLFTHPDDDAQAGPRRPTQVTSDVDDLSGAGESFCAVVRGRVVCWGTLGTVDASMPEVSRVAVGGTFACALTRDGGVWCWGKNRYGELARPREDASDNSQPSPVRGLPRISALAAGPTFVCAISEDDALWCWGRWPNGWDESDESTSVPVSVRVR
jgi:alpha-tubulin suppressor-like RCC1 family protein